MNAELLPQTNVLSGQVAIVTGAGRGIGRAIALALAGAGARVSLAARSREQLDETAALIQRAGGQALAIPADVADQSAVAALMEATRRRFGPPDLLVNNAAIGHKEATLWELEADEWWRVLEVNVRGRCSHRCWRAIAAGSLTWPVMSEAAQRPSHPAMP